MPPSVTARPSEPPTPTIAVRPFECLTACLADLSCSVTARRVMQTLFGLALETVRRRALPRTPDVAVFHLPLELLAAHLGISRETLWRHLKPLKALGLIDARDHYTTLRGKTRVSGKVWAVSMRPERHLSGVVEPVRLRISDLKFPWRDLDADVRRGRTVYAQTRTDERQALETAHRARLAPQEAGARARANTRKTERVQATRSGHQPPTGRQAATLNAANTRATRPPEARKEGLQQSKKRNLRAVKHEELLIWALTPFLPPTPDVTLTVAPSMASGLDAIHSLPLLAGLSRKDRSAAVGKVARSLAVTFEDAENLNFWYWLLWQLLRGYDQGQEWIKDVRNLLAQVYHDVRQDESMHIRSVKHPGALVAKLLKETGLTTALRDLKPMRVGEKPAAA